MTRFIGSLNGTWGRLGHIVLGLALLASGLTVLGDTTGLVLAAVGLVLLGIGISARCPLVLLAGRQPSKS